MVSDLTATSHSRWLTHYAIANSSAEDRSVRPGPPAHLLPPTLLWDSEGSQAPGEQLALTAVRCSLDTAKLAGRRDRHWDSDR